MRRLVPLAAVLLAASCSDAGGGTGADLPEATVERPEFLGDTAYQYVLQQVGFGPRIPGTEGHRRQLEWMRERLRQSADTVVEQAFTVTTTYGTELRLTNLFARFQPDAESRVLLVAHWDTRPKADQSSEPAEREMPVPGANDGASGTAVLLHLADLLRRQPPPIGVDFLLVDGEDYGPDVDDMLLGSRYFAANQPAGYRPMYGVLLDMVGDEDPRFPIERYSYDAAPQVVAHVWGIARELGYGDSFSDGSAGYIEDDHVPLIRAGIPTIDVIDLAYRWWHTPYDLPEHVSASTLGMVGDVVTELIYRGG